MNIQAKIARGRADVLTGACLVGLGGVAGWMAFGFDEQSRSYPMVLGIVLVGLGAILASRGLLGKGQPFGNVAQMHVQRLLLALVSLAIWIALVNGGAGYILPTFAVQTIFVLICGSRTPARVLIPPALITGISYVAFIKFLELPIETLF